MLGGWHRRSETNRQAADLLVTPDVDDIGLFEFDRIDDALPRRAEAVAAALAGGDPTVLGAWVGAARRR